MDAPRLDDGVVLLREWQDADAAWYAEQSRDPAIQRFTTDPSTLDEGQVLAAIERLRASDGHAGFVVCDAATGQRLGNVAAMLDGGVWDVSYWLSAAARGRGAATRALVLMSRWLVEPIGASTLRLRAHRDNTASRRVAERAGYVRDPERDGPQHAKGEVWPMLAYVLDVASTGRERGVAP